MIRRGFTLIEMIVSLAIVSVIGAALASVLHVAARAIPSESSVPELEASARAASVEIAGDLVLAQSIRVIDTNAVEFTVPDQTGDGTSETIRWDWGGTKGDPLVRTYNGVASSRITKADGVVFEWSTKTAAEQTGTTTLEGPEQLLAGFSDSNNSTAALGTNKYTAIGFTPTLPSDAVSFSVTRFTTRVTFNSATSLPFAVRREAPDGTPGTVIASGTLVVSIPANSSTNQSATVSGLSGLAPGTGLWIQFSPVSLLGSASMPYQTGVANGNTQFGFSTSAGVSWTVIKDGSALFAVYGKVVRPQPEMTNLTRAQSIRVSITPSGNKVRPLVAGVGLAARPLLPGQLSPITPAPIVSQPVGVTITAGVPVGGGTVNVDTTQVLNGLSGSAAGVVGILGKVLGL